MTPITLTLDDVSLIQKHLREQRRAMYREMIDCQRDMETAATCERTLTEIEMLMERISDARFDQCRAPAADLDLFTR